MCNTYDNFNRDFNIGHTVCRCMRYWTTLREAVLYDGYNCIDGVKSCDYCRDVFEDDESEEDDEL